MIMNSKQPSKRKLESYHRAELVCRAFRCHALGAALPSELMDLLIHWMQVTGKIKYAPVTGKEMNPAVKFNSIIQESHYE